MWRKVLLVVVMMLEGEFFMLGVVFLVVFMIGIMQLHKIHYADFFIMADEVVYKMIEKCTRFDS